jgi:hypothetical protein
MTSDDDLEDAWDALHAATPQGWYVGRPSHHPERQEWIMFAFDPSETAVMGQRARQWTAVHPTDPASCGRWRAACGSCAREGGRSERGARRGIVERSSGTLGVRDGAQDLTGLDSGA